MGIDRRVLSGAVALCYALLTIAAGRDRTVAPEVLVGSGVLFAVAMFRLLGRQRGALVALVVAAALNRYACEIAGATFKPEHIVAPLAGLVLLPDLRRLVRRLDLVDVLLLAWLGWSVIPGLLNAPDPGNSTRLWAMLVLVSFSYFAVVTTVRTAGRAAAMLRWWMLTGLAVGLYGIVEHVLYQAFDLNLGIQVNPVTGDPTIPGTFYEANLFGSATMMLALTGIGLLVFSARHTRLAWASAVVGTLAVQLSFTRTAWVAFVFGLLVMVVVRALYAPARRPAEVAVPAAGHPRLAPFASYLGVAALGSILLWGPFSNSPGALVNPGAFPTPTPPPAAAAQPTPVPTLVPLVQGTPVAGHSWTPVVREADIGGRVASISNMSDTSVKLRLKFIRIALGDWKEHPLVGLGIGSFGQTYVNTSNERAWLSMFAVRLLHDGGIIGVLLFAAPALMLAWRSLDLLRRPRGTETERAAIVLSIATLAMFVAFLATEGLQIAWYWWALGLFAAHLRIARARLPLRVG